MDIFDDEILKEKKKTNKLKIIIIVTIVILVMAAVGIFAAITYLQSQQLRLYVDGVGRNFSADTFVIEENGQVYISIKDIATALGYSFYNGEYGILSEDTTKCHVRNEYEAASFESNSKTIYKTSTQTRADTEYFYTTKPTRFLNGKIYITPEALQIAFNSTFSYDTQNNNIQIFTLDYLTTYYTSRIATYGYKEIVDNYNNKKSMIAGMIVVRKEDKKVGVIDLSGKEIIGAKYDDITYVETTKEFFVKNNSKVGLVSNTGKTKISSSYDTINLIDKDLKLYLVQNNNKYGVIDEGENKIIYLEYDKIGIDRSLFKNVNLTNQYLLFKNCIPVQRDKKWGMYDKKGQLILPIEYDTIGCVISTSQSGNRNNVVVVPDYEAIVVEKNKKYGLVSSLGNFIIEPFLDSIFSTIESGQEFFQFEYQGAITRLDTFLEEHGIHKVVKSTVSNPEADLNSIVVNNNTVNTTTQTNETTNTTNTPVENGITNIPTENSAV